MQYYVFLYHSLSPLVMDLENDRVLIAFRLISMINKDFILVVISKVENV